MIQNEYSPNPGSILQGLRGFFRGKDTEQEIELLRFAEVELIGIGHDEVSSATLYCLHVKVPPSSYKHIADDCLTAENKLLETAHVLLRPYPYDIVVQVCITPTLAEVEVNVPLEENSVKITQHPNDFVDLNRIDELRGITSPSFDLIKLIRLCEELNICYTNECFFAVAMLTRAILDHVPPIFGFKLFTEVANSYSGRDGKSFKKSMQYLENSSRSIADALLHLTVREKESLPNRVQVDFHNGLDVLLAEIVRVLK